MLNIGVYICIKNYIRIFINSRNNRDGSTCPYGQPALLSPVNYNHYDGIRNTMTALGSL